MPFTLGIIIPDTAFKRPVGDAGNAASYAHPVLFHVVPGIRAADIVRPAPNPDLLEPYLEGALALQRKGARAITTTCGFLSPLQDAIASKLDVPFIASSLIQLPLVHKMVQGRVGIITANDDALVEAFLHAAGVGKDIPTAILGLQRHNEFAGPILNDSGEIDFADVEKAIAGAASALMRQHPDIKAFVCECHNLAPFGPAIQNRTHRPVFDILTLLTMTAQAGSKPAFHQVGSPAR